MPDDFFSSFRSFGPRCVVSYLDSRRFLSRTFCFSIIAAAVTAVSYFLLSHLAYFPASGVGGTEVFLLPRFFPSQNGLTSGVFRAPLTLLVHAGIALALVLFAHFVLYRRVQSFTYFLSGCYILSFLMALNFLGFTQLGFEHLALQTKSINNGMWTAMDVLLARAEFSQASLLGKAQYIFTVIGSNNSGYTIPGTTHPPGIFLMSFVLRFLGQFTSPPIGWGIVITAINCILVVVVGFLARSCYSDRAARQTCLLLLTVPSLCLHFCAVIDGVPSVAIAAGILMILQFLKQQRPANIESEGLGLGSISFRQGAGTGLFFTLAAQFAYGLGVPILAALVALVSLGRDKRRRSYYLNFAFGLAIFPLAYFIMEYLLSHGTSFWPLRAVIISSLVSHGLDFRTYPLCQIANWVVMSVMGGVLWFPGIWIILHQSRQVRIEKQFIFRTLLLILFFLLFQKTVRLEVERTWHWAFILPWVAMGPACFAFESSLSRLFPDRSSKRLPTVLLLCLIQLGLSICLAVSIQDYY